MQVLTATQIRNAPWKWKTLNADRHFLVCYHSEQLIELFCIGESALPFSWSSYNVLDF